MNIDAITPAYLQVFDAPVAPVPVDVPQPSKDFSFRIGESREAGFDFTRMIKAAQAGDVVAKQEIDRLGESQETGCCGAC